MCQSHAWVLNHSLISFIDGHIIIHKKVHGRVIFRNLKLGGINKFLGGVNMRKAQIYIKIHYENRNNYTELGEGGVTSLNWRVFPPFGGGGEVVKISVVLVYLFELVWLS